MNKKLTKDFYQRNVNKVAKELLGKTIVVNSSNVLSGKIVEVEAYDSVGDEASHSFNGKTKRNSVMFESGGLLYVYFTYGMHYCANIVTGPKDKGAAVLIRGIEPISGVEQMAINRYGKEIISDKERINLTNGPAKFCQAFGFTKFNNGTDLTSNEIFILNSESIKTSEIVIAKRIGIKKSVDLPWRYYIKNNPFVSKK